MTREELIRRIEAGETVAELRDAITKIAGWDDGKEDARIAIQFVIGPIDQPCIADTPDWLHSIDAALSLLYSPRWTVTSDGLATVAAESGEVFVSEVSGNPAAALVAAWLKATSEKDASE